MVAVFNRTAVICVSQYHVLDAKLADTDGSHTYQELEDYVRWVTPLVLRHENRPNRHRAPDYPMRSARRDVA